MICTAGTSSGRLNGSAASIMDAVMNPEDKNRLSAAEIIRNPEKNKDIFMSDNFGKGCKFPSAELQTILKWLRKNLNDIDTLRVILLPSNEYASKITAQVTALCLQRLKPLFPSVKLIDDAEIIPLDIAVNSRENFLSSIAALFSELDTLTAQKTPDEEVIICSTGGYKAVASFLMMYAQLHSLPCLYSFELSDSDAYEVMSVPLGYAYSSLDEEINMLKAVSRNADIDKSSLPQWVKDSESMACELLKSYYDAREKPYGMREELFRMLRRCLGGQEWADYLQDLLAHKWADLWLGDQISVTVEHSRRHSKRLMELAANLFRSTGGKIPGFPDDDPKPLVLLIASIYLHDIGHTALSYPVIVSDDIHNENLFPLGLFPSAVRELHLIFTVGNLILAEEKFSETLRPLEDRAEGIKDIIPTDMLLKVTALLRLIDGCDVQSDRVISPCRT